MPTFNAGGLASGLDTNTLVDALVKVRNLAVDRLKGNQGAVNAQISAMGDITSKLQALKTAASGLSSTGILGVSVGSGLDGLTATATSQAQAGRYSVQVTALAAAAKQRSTGFIATTPPLTAGTLSISVNGTATDVNVGAGATLSDVAQSINAAVSDVSAVVLSDGTASYLSITNRATGHTVGAAASTALQISGTAAAQFGFTTVVAAANAHLNVDGLDFERRSNTITDAIPGVTFTLSESGGPAQDMVLSNDSAGTAKNLQGFIDAYNGVLKAVQKQLQVGATSNRGVSLSGDAALRNLQSQLQALTARTVGSTSVRSLADLGIETGRDGTLTLDTVTLDKAVSKDPAAVNALFSTANTGLSALTVALADGQTNSTDGVLTVRTQGMQGQAKRLGKDIERAQAAVERYRELLIKQFTAMEQVVGQLKATGNYLSARDAAMNQK